jgi:2-polyprenyl-3-methyl-5-hydroxy-6-metoxy-1,4-benzoquinol methylase
VIKEPVALDQERLHQAVGRFLGDVGAAISGALVLIGDHMGLYKALAEGGPLTAEELALRTDTHERYVREWLANQAASGYLTYDPATQRFALPPEHVPLLADDSSELNMCGLFGAAQVLFVDEPKASNAFRTGAGIDWGDHDARLFGATDRLFRSGYAANLVKNWIPALSGVEAKLRDGAFVADVGCGYGSSTILMAKAYPKSRFIGYDCHEPSIEAARTAAGKARVSDRVQFEVALANSYRGTGFDLVTCFDCIHDMGDPVAALAHIRRTLKSDGVLMMVEPFANDALEDNLNPISRIFYGASTMLCTPAATAQGGRRTLGAQAGEARMRAVAAEAGFSQFRRATETPFNLVYEARA